MLLCESRILIQFVVLVARGLNNQVSIGHVIGTWLVSIVLVHAPNRDTVSTFGNGFDTSLEVRVLWPCSTRRGGCLLAGKVCLVQSELEQFDGLRKPQVLLKEEKHLEGL